MYQDRLPKPGEIYNHFKDRPYQIITVATHTETNEQMVVYQALYGDFKMFVRPLSMFLSEVDHVKYPEVKQTNRFELKSSLEDNPIKETSTQTNEMKTKDAIKEEEPDVAVSNGEVNFLLMKFLDAESYSKKLDVLTSNRKHINDRLINDMAVALDCTVEDGPLDTRIQGLVNCLQQMCRFENRRLR